MTFSRFFLSFLLCLSCAAPLQQAFAAKKKAAETARAYKGAIAMDAATGKILFEDNADIVTPPASMTKLMTFAVLHDMIQAGNISLETQVTATAPDTKIGGTQVWLAEHEVFTVEELVYAMMIQSANDAAYALARTSAGSVQAFVGRMNEKARELGMTRTTFRSPHGLPPANRSLDESDLTTPRDFAILCKYLLTNTDIVKYTSIRSRPFGKGQRMEPVIMNNHNHLVGRVAGADGLKTGYTASAGYCLSATAQRNGKRVIVVVMGSPSIKARDNRVIEMLEEAFAKIPVGSPDFVGSEKPKVIGVDTAPIGQAPEGKKEAAKPGEEEPMIKVPTLPPSRRSSK